MAKPFYRLYASDGVTLIYDFDLVTDDDNGSPFLSPTSFVEYNSLRGQGSIISEGSLEPFDITLTFILTGDDYEDLAAQINALNTTIAFNTPYILKVELVIGGSTKNIKVKRLQDFSFPLDRARKRTRFQTVQIVLRALSWS